jgi:hypothetical protein
MRVRLMIAALLGLALTSAGCASTTSPAPATAPLPAWSADAVGHGSKLLVLRTAQTTTAPDALEIDDLASGEATRVWAAPPGWDARLLCADRNGIAIALSRHGQSDVGSKVTTVSGSGMRFFAAPVDQQIVVLRPDGTALQSSLPSGSIGVVSSAAFIGDTLVIARQGPMLRNPTPAEPALMDSHGHFTLLDSGAIRLDQGKRLQSLVALPEGGVAAGIFESYGIATGPTLGIVRLNGGSLEVTATAARALGKSPYEMAAGSTTGTVIFAIVTDTSGGARLPIALAQANVFATPASDTVLARAVWPRRTFANGPAPAASMGGGRYIVAINRVVSDIDIHLSAAMARQLASQPTTSATLLTLDASGTLHPTPVGLYYARPSSPGDQGWLYSRPDTWLWLGAFGR